MTAQSPAQTVLHGARLVAAGLVLQAMLATGAHAALNQEQAREMEALLARLNFDPGPIDGVIDERTRAAITLYQQFAALPEDGEPNEALLGELRGVAGAFVDLKAQRESQSGADAGVAVMRAEETPEPEPGSEPDAAADATAAAGPGDNSEETPADPLPRPLADEMGLPDGAVGAPDGQEARAQTAPATREEPTPAAETPATAPPQPAEPKPEAAKPEAAGFSIRSVLAKLLGSDKEPEAVASETVPETDSEPAEDAAAATEIEVPAEVPDPAESTEEGDAAGDSGIPGEVQTASVARGGYAAFGAAHAAARDNSLERAIAAYTVALRSEDLTSEHAALAHYNRADALYRLRRYEEAIADYNAAIAADPSFADAYYNRGYAYLANGERRRAITDFRKARELGLQRVGDRAPSAPPPSP